MGLALSQAQSWLARRTRICPALTGNSSCTRARSKRSGARPARQQEVLRIKAEEELARLRAQQDAREQRERADAEERARHEAEVAAGSARIHAQRLRVLVGVLSIAIVAGVTAWQYQTLHEFAYWFANVRSYVLTAAQESALKPQDTFKECAENCPEMVVVPAGHFTMGSPATEAGRYVNEGPQHDVTIAKPFAASKFEVTFDEWDACAAVAVCTNYIRRARFRSGTPAESSMSRSTDAEQYVAWLSRR